MNCGNYRTSICGVCGKTLKAYFKNTHIPHNCSICCDWISKNNKKAKNLWENGIGFKLKKTNFLGDNHGENLCGSN